MQAVILAAGEGRRLRPLTLEVPKPFLKVNGKPILEHTLENLPKAVKEIILVVGYKREQIEDYFGNEFGGRNIKYVFQEKPLGTFHALRSSKEFLKNEPFLVLVGDDFYSRNDLEKLVGDHPSILACETKTPERFGICQLNEDGSLKDIIEKPDYPCGNLASTGACVLPKEIFQEEIIYGANGEELLAPMIGSLTKKIPFKVIRTSYWLPISYPEDLQKAEEFLSPEPILTITSKRVVR